MGYATWADFLTELDRLGELQRITAEVGTERELDVAVGQYADQFAALGHRQVPDAALAQECMCLGQRRVDVHRKRKRRHVGQDLRLACARHRRVHPTSRLMLRHDNRD